MLVGATEVQCTSRCYCPYTIICHVSYVV